MIAYDLLLHRHRYQCAHGCSANTHSQLLDKCKACAERADKIHEEEAQRAVEKAVDDAWERFK